MKEVAGLVGDLCAGVDKVQELNRELILLNSELAEANRRQTARCKRLEACRRLLEEVYARAWEEKAMYYIGYELMDRIGIYLAELAAIERTDAEQRELGVQ